MPSDGPARREFLGAIGGAAAVWLSAPWPELLAAGAEAAHTSAAQFLVLSPSEAAELEAIAAQIIPSDATPGAREARVVTFIDRSLATFAKSQRALIADGLARLPRAVAAIRPGTESFAALPGPDQIAVLRALEAAKSPFFEAVRVATITGLLAHPKYGGNYAKVGWKLIGFEDRFSWTPPYGYYDRP
jgi:gluconate 2-dehydrogenase gamma chain